LKKHAVLFFLPAVLLLVAALGAALSAAAQMHASAEEPVTHESAASDSSGQSGPEPSMLVEHPSIIFLDDRGENILSSRRPVSTMRTCGNCHDTEFIADHNYHATVGLDEWRPTGRVPGGRPWDNSPGEFGRWNPLFYRYLTMSGAAGAAGDGRFDLGEPGWVRLFGIRHAGGGPAVRDPEGTRLNELPAKPVSPASLILDAATGAAVPWDWKQSGLAEFDCFLCHVENPDNVARTQALHDGAFDWAAAATLARTGLVSRAGGRWLWNEKAFDNNGSPDPKRLRIMAPLSSHCGQCHGLVQTGEDPVIVSYGSLELWRTETTGQIFSPQSLFESGINLAGKDAATHPWDIHAERLLICSNCHFALNNPGYAAEADASRPAHLAFDARRLGISQFLYRPNHNFAKGWSAQGTVANDLDGTMRRCENCHQPLVTHDWLPYKKRHMERLLCETCHVPKAYAAARSVTDWTVLTGPNKPRLEYRGARGNVNDPAVLVEGYRPALVPRWDGSQVTPRLGPQNLIVTWCWIYGDPPRPVRLFDLNRAYFDGGGYAPDIVAAFDADGNGEVDETELILDSPQKTAAVHDRLESLGVDNPRMYGEIQPYGLHHGVVTEKWATKDCRTCHSRDSIIDRSFRLAAAAPQAGPPALVGDSDVKLPGVIETGGGKVVYKPASIESGFYILGYNRWRGIDSLGILIILAVLAGVVLHGGFRLIFSRRRSPF